MGLYIHVSENSTELLTLKIIVYFNLPVCSSMTSAVAMIVVMSSDDELVTH